MAYYFIFVVVSTYQDPIPGWTNNLTGINGLCIGIGIGFIRNIYVDTDFPIEIICADYVINSTLAAIWAMAIEYIANEPRIPIKAEIFQVTRRGNLLTSSINSKI